MQAPTYAFPYARIGQLCTKHCEHCREGPIPCPPSGGHDNPDKAHPVAIMFHHYQLGVLALAGSVGSAYHACAVPCLALLRKLGVCPPASALPNDDLSGRVVIVTGANTGEHVACSTNTALCSRHTRLVCNATEVWCPVSVCSLECGVRRDCWQIRGL